MPTDVHASRWLQITAWAIVSLFLFGYFYHPLGALTGTIMGVWFVLSQRPWRGFLWMLAAAYVFNPPAIWHSYSMTVGAYGLRSLPQFLIAVPLAYLLGVLPFTLHRLASPRLPGFLATLPFPLAKVLFALALPLMQSPIRAGQVDVTIFFTAWLASIVVWMWNLEFRLRKIKAGLWVLGTLLFAAAGAALTLHFHSPSRRLSGFGVSANSDFLGLCLGGLLALSVWAALRSPKRSPWAQRREAVARLRSPFSGSPLHVESEGRSETLVSSSGERFSIRNGIPSFLKPQDLTGDNGKYNHVYETIGGFYDDIQRAFCALKGFDRDAYFRGYMSRLEVKPGDSVLETSVGTGLNYKYLPRGAKLTGLDLSPEMLAHCQENLRRWDLDADLYLGNAESLPFADESFDVVFHVGGINFFNDRAKAIQEMIRVVKPGSLLLITDETEKHVKEVYEKHSGSLWRNRKEPVKAPVDLIPQTMEEIHLDELRGGDTYTLTFRKPRVAAAASTASMDAIGGAGRGMTGTSKTTVDLFK